MTLNTGIFLFGLILQIFVLKMLFAFHLCCVFYIWPTTKIIWAEDHGLVTSDRLNKPGIKPATPGLQSEWFIHYNTALQTTFIMEASSMNPYLGKEFSV